MAYQEVFNTRRLGALGAPADARRFQRDVMSPRLSKLNPAHFFLASILGVQPGPRRPSKLFRTESAFCRLILTTNFDPFLQIALQMMNQLYVVTDSPEIRIGDEIRDEENDVVQLVYVHGSIHRRKQVADEASIANQKILNTEALAPILRDHGVIVLGYSGWDDVIVDALKACPSFDHRLFWCDLKSSPDQLLQPAQDVLAKDSTFYVTIRDAGAFLSRMSIQAVHGLPRLLENPVAQLRECLESLDLTELDSEVAEPQAAASSELSDIAPHAFANKLESTLELLRQAEALFVSPAEARGVDSERHGDGAYPEDRPALGVEEGQTVRRLIASAQIALSMGSFSEVLRLSSEVFSSTDLSLADYVSARMVRATAYYRMGDLTRAADDLTLIIDGLESNDEQVAQALHNRGVVWGQAGEPDKALADYTRVIEDLPGTPVEQVARALVNRGVVWGQTGEPDKALADYTRVIEDLPGAPVELVAKALVNRGVVWGLKREPDKEMADYTRVIEDLPGTPVEQVSRALVNRGVVWGRKGEPAKALADYTRVIEDLPGAPVEQVAKALFNRGVVWGLKREPDKEMADYTRVIEDLPGTPVEQVSRALVNRGVVRGRNGEPDKALADYTRVIENLPGVPVEQVAKALLNRGVVWGQKGEPDKEMSDYTRLIEDLPGAPVEQVAKALFNRGEVWGEKGEPDKALAEYTRVIEDLPGAAVKEVAMALLSRGVVWRQKGEPDKEQADYTRVIEDLPGAPVEQVAKALFNRGEVWREKGEPDKALAEYTRVIEDLPGAPVDQVAKALVNRGWTYYRQKASVAFLHDTETSLKYVEDVVAAFNLGLALLVCHKDAEALVAYGRAAGLWPDQIAAAGLADLEEAQRDWLSAERGAPIVAMLSERMGLVGQAPAF
ncbi:tetratricopeptide repeat protein [Paludibaculum fermentans]|uniref:tetratricopeptide repeat protein n=1 Tax=Paludibaculum fermentans TaxID=1473598 RepID=UPI003EBC6AF3